MPPVMGAVAFLMAEMTGIEYASIAIAALIPALLYYATLSVSVYLIARRDNIPAANPDEIQPFWKVFKSGWLYAIPLVVLVYLIVSGLSVQMSAFYSIWVTLVVGFIMNRKEITVKNILAAFEGTVKSIAPVAAACILAGIIMGSMSLTGFGLKISSLIEQLSGGNLLFSLVLAMIASLLLGMGLPTTAAYVLGASVLAPALITLGIPALAAHLFVMYYACLSALTPPVCVAVFMAAGLAKANWFKTGCISCMVALPIFVVPFTFCYNPALLLEGSALEVVTAVITALLGVVLIDICTVGYLKRPVNPVLRILLLVGGILLLIPSYVVSLIGFVIGGAAFMLARRNSHIAVEQ